MTSTAAWIAWPQDRVDQTNYGGKGAALARLGALGFDVPPWFAVLPAAFDAAFAAEERDAFPTAASEPGPRIAPEVAAAIDGAAALLEAPFAVRSSARDEDGAEHSFAGQLESFLAVEREDVAARVVDVWRSGFSERLRAYRASRGLRGAPTTPTVLVQRMVRSDVSGVAFAADPTTGRLDCALVAAVRGTAEGLVSGDLDADTWRIGRSDGRIERRGEAAVSTGLSDGQIRSIARLVHAVSDACGRPQDIEWAFEGERLHLLQARPITTLEPPAVGLAKIWDNSNIAESYGGVTSPLTFSFARAAYEGVYREFCRLMGVDEERIAAADEVFKGMLGRIDGRVYYDLLNWYRLIALLPGSALNRGFMEQMMGVRRTLPQEFRSSIGDPAHASRIVEWLRVGRCSLELLRRFLGVDAASGRFRARLDAALARPDPPIDAMRLDELARHYRDLESKLLRRWDAPIVNDFFAMISFGLLRSLVAKWCPDAPPSFANELVCDLGDVVSAEPVRRLRAMGRAIASNAGLVATLRDAPAEDAAAAARGDPILGPMFEAYLEAFGDRCLEELKLESKTLVDDPTTLVRSIAEIASRPEDDETEPRVHATSPASDRLDEAIRGGPLRRAAARFVLRQAIARLRGRENLRFERTRVFGRVRRIVVAMGRRLHEAGRLDRPDDVFFLEVDELLGWVEGTTTTADLAGLVRVRSVEDRGHRAMPAPPDRFITRGPVASSRREPDEAPAANSPSDADGLDERHGLGCRPGVARGRVRLIRDPRGAVLRPGEILVAERTDPGWVLLFPVSKGVVVERGSLLSHTAIVARELGLPAIVSLPGLTSWLEDGDLVEMDGGTGRVTRLERARRP
jgi:pyruvate,water dikinase